MTSTTSHAFFYPNSLYNPLRALVRAEYKMVGYFYCLQGWAEENKFPRRSRSPLACGHVRDVLPVNVWLIDPRSMTPACCVDGSLYLTAEQGPGRKLNLGLGRQG